MKKIVIIGATSAIAEATARIWAEQGACLFLVARNKEHLDRIAKDLEVRGSPKVDAYHMDINDLESHRTMLALAKTSLDGIDSVLIAHGTLSDQQACQQSVELTMHEIKTNALSTIALLTLLANQFEQQKQGTIAVISSVAGDRGRQSNYVYASAKAMVTVFTSGMRQRLTQSGVTLITIKPGFVDTPMTKMFKKGVLWASPEKVAHSIAIAMSKKSDIVYVPKFWYIIMLILKLVPEPLFKRLKL